MGSTALDSSSIIIADNLFAARVPLSLLPSTGFSPEQFDFNLWPRAGQGLNQISDFAPDNANLSISSVPEPALWALMIVRFGGIATAMRRRRGFGFRRAHRVAR